MRGFVELLAYGILCVTAVFVVVALMSMAMCHVFGCGQ